MKFIDKIKEFFTGKKDIKKNLSTKEILKQANRVYFTNCGSEMSRNHITHFLKFYVEYGNDFVNVDTAMLYNYYYLRRYAGKKKVWQNTISVLDFDMVKLYQDLGGKLFETVLA